MTKRFDRLREAALAREFAPTTEERQRANKDFKKLKRKANNLRIRRSK